jgi:hypothetical protein
VVTGTVVLQPDLEQCACQDCFEAHVAAKQAARVTLLRSAAIRAYQKRQTAFAVRFAEEVIPRWDE